MRKDSIVGVKIVACGETLNFDTSANYHGRAVQKFFPQQGKSPLGRSLEGPGMH